MSGISPHPGDIKAGLNQFDIWIQYQSASDSEKDNKKTRLVTSANQGFRTVLVCHSFWVRVFRVNLTISLLEADKKPYKLKKLQAWRVLSAYRWYHIKTSDLSPKGNSLI